MSRNETEKENFTAPELVRMYMKLFARHRVLLEELQDAENRMVAIELEVQQKTDCRIDTETGQLQQGTISAGIREFLGAQLQPIRAHVIEEWLTRRGYGSPVEYFSQTMHSLLRSMPDVLCVKREGVLTHWALDPEQGGKAAIEEGGWRIIHKRRRTTLDSRFTESEPTSHYDYQREYRKTYVRTGKGLHTKIKRAGGSSK